MARRRFSEREVLQTLLYQGASLPCYRCGGGMVGGLAIEREHILELALGGKDTPDNCAYSHAVCHALVTNGPKATSAGSSKHRIAKTKRLAKGPRQRKGRAIKGRGFQKPTVKKPWPKRKRQPGA